MSRRDQDAIRGLKPGESLTIKGVRIERCPDGDLRYLVNAVVDGRRIHQTIGLQSQGMNHVRARAHVERVKTEAREGRLQLLGKGRKIPMSFGAAADLYIPELEASGGKNVAKKRQHLDQHLVPALRNERLSTLTRLRLEGYRKQRLDEGASEATCNREMATVSHLLTIAVEKRWISAKPCRVPKSVEPDLPKTVLSDAEQEALLRAAMNDRDAYVFTAMAINTAMRHSEILAARYEQVDWDNLRLTIPVAKAGPRSQPITPWLRDLLRREQGMAEDEAGWIFPAARPGLAENGHRMTMARPFARVVATAGLGRHIHPHLLRHTAISQLIKAGTDLKTVQKISGHKTLAMLLRYLQTSDPEIDRAMAVLGKFLPGSYQDRSVASSGPFQYRPQNVVVFKKKG